MSVYPVFDFHQPGRQKERKQKQQQQIYSVFVIRYCIFAYSWEKLYQYMSVCWRLHSGSGHCLHTLTLFPLTSKAKKFHFAWIIAQLHKHFFKVNVTLKYKIMEKLKCKCVIGKISVQNGPILEPIQKYTNMCINIVQPDLNLKYTLKHFI